ERESAALRLEPLEVGHEEERGAEEKYRRAFLRRTLQSRVGHVPPRLTAAHDPHPARRQLLNDPVDHEPERGSRRLRAWRPKDERGKSGTVWEQVRLEAPEQRGFIEHSGREPHA